MIFNTFGDLRLLNRMGVFGYCSPPNQFSLSFLLSHRTVSSCLLCFLTPNQLYGQLDRHIQAMVSTTMVGGYKLQGAAVAVPPNAYTYSDTGMFQDTDETWYILTSADHNTVQVNKINSDGTIGAKASQLSAFSSFC